MQYLKRFITSIGLSLGTILLLLVMYTILQYFEILTSNFFITFIMVVSIFTGSFYLGSFAKSKGYLEGLKFGSAFSLIALIISLFTKPSFGVSVILYYSIIYATSIMGSVLGINIKKTGN